jgi:effector-binding domain-containing protein
MGEWEPLVVKAFAARRPAGRRACHANPFEGGRRFEHAPRETVAMPVDTSKEITHRRLEKMLFAHAEVRTESRSDILAKVEQLGKVLGDRIVGPPTVLLHWATGEKGLVADVGFPVARRVSRKDMRTETLEPVEALTLVHLGPYETIRDTYVRILDNFREMGMLMRITSREQLLSLDPDEPERSVIEVQWPIHDWAGILAGCIEHEMGGAVRDDVMRGIEGITADTPKDARREWTLGAIRRFDAVANDEQRFECLSRCADEFSAKRIERLRAIYQRSRSVDAVLKEMRKDFAWHEGPQRKGRVITVQKVPFDPEGLKKARSKRAARAARCHCNLIREHLDEVPGAYCWCGAGWYRQQWEGILGRPVRVELVGSLARGDDVCTFAIHLPKGVRV